MASTVTDMAMGIKTINSIFLFTQQKYRIKEILIWEDFSCGIFLFSKPFSLLFRLLLVYLGKGLFLFYYLINNSPVGKPSQITVVNK